MAVEMKWMLWIVPLLVPVVFPKGDKLPEARWEALNSHKFYLSVTQVYYKESQNALQITMRIFTDDFDAQLEQAYGHQCRLDTDKESDRAGDYIESYTTERFVIYLDGERQKLSFLGWKYDMDQTVVYLELPQSGFKKARSIGVQNKLLLGAFEEQKNMTHLKLGEITKTWVFYQGSTKEVLKIN